MAKTSQRLISRKKRQARVRKTVRGTSDKPRLCVYRSLRYTYAHLVVDENNAVIASLSSKSIENDGKSRSSKEAAKLVGMGIAAIAKEKSISKVVFDRNGYLFHGRVAAVAEGAREGGLEI